MSNSIYFLEHISYYCAYFCIIHDLRNRRFIVCTVFNDVLLDFEMEPQLTLKYNRLQQGPIFYFQAESSTNFLCRDLFAIAYTPTESMNYFTTLSNRAIQDLNSSIGNICASHCTNNYCMAVFAFTDVSYLVCHVSYVSFVTLANLTKGGPRTSNLSTKSNHNNITYWESS